MNWLVEKPLPPSMISRPKPELFGRPCSASLRRAWCTCSAGTFTAPVLSSSWYGMDALLRTLMTSLDSLSEMLLNRTV